MKSSRLNREGRPAGIVPAGSRTGGTMPSGWLYGLAFLLALGLRLIQLGALPLTDLEAGPALQAFRLAQGLKPALSPQPAYILFTAPLFFAYGGATDFLARLIPALAGSFLVFIPVFFRHRIPALPAILLAFFLAIDPGLLALSRQAASSILAITFLLYAWAFWENHQARLAGFFAGLALLGGPHIWAGLLALGITWAVVRGMKPREQDEEHQVPEPTTRHREESRRDRTLDTDHWPLITEHRDASRRDWTLTTGDWKPALTTLLLTLLFIGTLFFLAPNGLSAALASLPAYIGGWWTPSGVPGSRILASLFFYQPLILLLALSAILHGWRNGERGVIGLGIWMLVAFLLVMFHPAHQVTDLGWVLIPLSALAALELSRQFDIQPEERAEVAGVAALTALLLIFAWLVLSSLLWLPVPSADATTQTWKFFGSLFLLAVSLVLVAFGWSIRAAQRGGLWGAAIALGIYSISAGISAAGLRAGGTTELWLPGAYPAQADLLVSTVSDLSEWETGYVNSLPVTITNVDSPALLWALREYEVNPTNVLDVTSAPPIVVTSFEVDPGLAAVYRGQDFAWRRTPQWEGLLYGSAWEWISHWLRWLILRDLPQTDETILLWARDDLFLDAAPRPAP